MQTTLYRRLGACITALFLGCGDDGRTSETSSTSHGLLGSTSPPLLGNTSPPLLGNTAPDAAEVISIEAAIEALYRTAFGSETNPEDLSYWFDIGRGGGSLRQIADAFTNSAAFVPISQKSNEAFVRGLYENALGREGDAAGVIFWTDALMNGQTRADLLLQFSRVAGLSEVEIARLCATERLVYWCGA